MGLVKFAGREEGSKKCIWTWETLEMMKGSL
jgi:hypothetical protein